MYGASTSALAELRAAQAKLSRAIYSPGATASDAAIESARRELSSAQDKAAAAWLKAHPDVLDAWLAGVTTKDGGDAMAAVKGALGL